MRDKATIRRLQMYRTGGKVVRSVPGLYANYPFLMVWLQISIGLMLYAMSNTMWTSVYGQQ